MNTRFMPQGMLLLFSWCMRASSSSYIVSIFVYSLHSTREVGAEKSQLKVDIERMGRPNTFTTSFNGFRYRDFGLNTAITKSKICDQLDYS